MSNNINNKRFSVCNCIKKSQAIELLKNNLTAEELKSLIQPNYTHLIKMLRLYSKKDLQYLFYNTQKITMDKIINNIRQNAVLGGGDDEDCEEEDNDLKKSTIEDISFTTNTDLLLSNINTIKKVNENTETQTDKDYNNQLEVEYPSQDDTALQVEISDINTISEASISKASISKGEPPFEGSKKTTKLNKKVRISDTSISDTSNSNTINEGTNEVELNEFLNGDTFVKLKQVKSLKRLIDYLNTKTKLKANEKQKVMDKLADTTKEKIGKYSPGKHIPIISHENFIENYPDYAYLFAWNHKEEIFKKEKDYISKGGKWFSHVEL